MWSLKKHFSFKNRVWFLHLCPLGAFSTLLHLRKKNFSHYSWTIFFTLSLLVLLVTNMISDQWWFYLYEEIDAIGIDLAWSDVRGSRFGPLCQHHHLGNCDGDDGSDNVKCHKKEHHNPVSSVQCLVKWVWLPCFEVLNGHKSPKSQVAGRFLFASSSIYPLRYQLSLGLLF